MKNGFLKALVLLATHISFTVVVLLYLYVIIGGTYLHCVWFKKIVHCYGLLSVKGFAWALAIFNLWVAIISIGLGFLNKTWQCLTNLKKHLTIKHNISI